jgi:bifunctional enzyme CysN/CysC
MDVDTLHREANAVLGLNDIGRVEISTAQPICFDPYSQNAATGSFVLVDPFTNVTVAAGMIRSEVREVRERPARNTSPDVVWADWNIAREQREAKNGHKAAVVWFTGLSGSGKSTIARAVEQVLFEQGCQTMLLDGDQLRHGLNGDLGFSAAERSENIRRAGEVARLFFEQGAIVLCTFISPYREDRERIRALLPEGRFLEIFVDCDPAECARRDPKGLYRKANAGQIDNFTAVSAPYEPPVAAALRLDTSASDASVSRDAVLALLRAAGLVPDRTTT